MRPGDNRLSELEFLGRLLDERFRIPGTSIRFGLDGLIGLIPGAGDAATTLVSLYIVYRAHQLGASTSVIGRMLANVAIDTVVGSVPIVGDLFDVGFKANRRNLELLRRSLGPTIDAVPSDRSYGARGRRV